MAGKGGRYRPVDKAKFDANFDRIFAPHKDPYDQDNPVVTFDSCANLPDSHKNSPEKFFRNKIRCRKCGTEIESKSVHDFKYCSCGGIAVDGGNDYWRRCGKSEDIEEVWEPLDFRPTWTTQEGKVIPLAELTDNHLNNIIVHLRERFAAGQYDINTIFDDEPILKALAAEAESRRLTSHTNPYFLFVEDDPPLSFIPFANKVCETEEETGDSIAPESKILEPWEIQWYICAASHTDVRAAADKGESLELGTELWRVPKSIGPINIDHDHWAGWHLDLSVEDAERVARLPLLERYARLEAEYSDLVDRRKSTYSLESTLVWAKENGCDTDAGEPIGQWLSRLRREALDLKED